MKPTVDNAPWLPHGPRPVEIELDKSWPPYWPEIMAKAVIFLFSLAGFLSGLLTLALVFKAIQ